MDATLLGVFSSRANAENAIAELSKEGFDARDISLVMKDTAGEPTINPKTGHHNGTNIAESAASGVVTGGVLGGLAGFLIGLGAITLPGIGGLLVGGPIAAALGLVGAVATTVSGALTGAVAGGIVGALVGLGLPEEEAKVYESRVKDGGILIAVPVMATEEDRVRDILTQYSADMIRSVTSSRRNYQYQSVPHQFYPEESSAYPQESSAYPQESSAYNDNSPIAEKSSTSAESYYIPDRYSKPQYPQESYAYYSDVRPIRKKASVDEYHGDSSSYSEPIRDDQTPEEVRHTARSLKEKLRKLFS